MNIDLVKDILIWILGGVGMVVLAYAVVRAASIAHFRTRLEFFRKLAKESGGKDGEVV